MGKPTLTPNEWEPYKRYVQTGMVDGNYASGAFTLISAGPPRLGNAAALTGALTWPIGMVQNFTLSHNSQFNRIFEIGSERSYFVRGRSTGQMSLGRVLYHGPSILRALYATFSDYNVTDGVGVPYIGFPGKVGMAAASALHPNQHNVKINPGYENLYLNLASDMFSNPIGLMIKTMDSNEQTIGVVYAEGCYIPNHSFSTDSQGLLVQEQVSIQFERLVPVKTSVVQMVGDAIGASASLVTAQPPSLS